MGICNQAAWPTLCPPVPGEESPKTRRSSTDDQQPQLSDRLRAWFPAAGPWGLGSGLAAPAPLPGL